MLTLVVVLELLALTPLTDELVVNRAEGIDVAGTARTYALCNQKGGVGKSTTTFHLARAAVAAGRKVLLVDADPQGNLTAAATAETVDDEQAGLADVLSAQTSETIRDVTVAGVWPGMDVVPTSGGTLGYVRDELVIAGAGREMRLRKALTAVAGDYDLILIDSAPSLDQLTLNSLTAADGVVIVSQSKAWSLSGLGQLLTTIEDVRTYYNHALQIAGVIVNQHEDRTISGQTWLKELESAAADRGLVLLDPPIPKRVVISDAIEAARGLDEWGSPEAIALANIYSRHITAIEGALT